jgi:membrane protein
MRRAVVVPARLERLSRKREREVGLDIFWLKDSSLSRLTSHRAAATPLRAHIFCSAAVIGCHDGARMSPGTAWKLVKQTVTAWSDDRASSMGAALSYYTLFSIAPLLLIVISVAGFFFGDAAARGELMGQLQGLLGTDGARAVEALLKSVNKPTEGLIATVAGIAALLLGATGVFAELQNDLDRIWRAPVDTRGSGVMNLLWTRLLSFGLVLGFAFLLIVSLVASAVVSALGKWWGPMFGGWEVIAQLINFAVGFALMTGMFAMIYKLMPRVRIAWRDVWIGAAVTSLLFAIGKLLIGLYLGKSGVTSAFGAAGSLVLVMVWVYYSAQIFLLGAEFTWVYAHCYGSRTNTAVSREIDPESPGPAPHTSAITGGEVLVLGRQQHAYASRAWLNVGMAAGAGLIAALLTRRHSSR